MGQLARPFCRPVGNRPPSKDQCDDTAIFAEIESGLAYCGNGFDWYLHFYADVLCLGHWLVVLLLLHQDPWNASA